ncbi:hypothetical protein KUTeg_009389 [Tegillarca granosa]|uniref:Uncharacterized protein n=1 Tax=Tegillarca granosa TaxID=220873 RepID=A0ABQ9F606_TEGGR|nr:hypothetical protein KUTeg_009389 [Tegillarca granosa]
MISPLLPRKQNNITILRRIQNNITIIYDSYQENKKQYHNSYEENKMFLRKQNNITVVYDSYQENKTISPQLHNIQNEFSFIYNVSNCYLESCSSRFFKYFVTWFQSMYDIIAVSGQGWYCFNLLDKNCYNYGQDYQCGSNNFTFYNNKFRTLHRRSRCVLISFFVSLLFHYYDLLKSKFHILYFDSNKNSHDLSRHPCPDEIDFVCASDGITYKNMYVEYFV